MMGWGFGMGWPGFFFMFVFWIVVIVAVVLLIRWIITSTGSGSRNKGHDDSAIEILKKRYAHGEINKEEFEDKKKDLEK
ncbi:MAG: SHOCT domain-containing protein [Nitrospirae bacterium]|nr:SHOCT domain-containing protein [Nitrospirota bacterium]